MIRRPIIGVLFGVTLAAVGLGGMGCRTVEHGAAKDPQRCERDPSCTKKQDKSRDCATACVDNIDCMERCQQINGQR